MLFIIENSYVLISISGSVYIRMTDSYFKSRTQNTCSNSNCEYCAFIAISAHIYNQTVSVSILSLQVFGCGLKSVFEKLFIIRWEKNLIINIFYQNIYTVRHLSIVDTIWDVYLAEVHTICTSSNLETYSVQIFHFGINVTLHKSGLEPLYKKHKTCMSEPPTSTKVIWYK